WMVFAQLISWVDQASAAPPGPDAQCDRYAARKLGEATAAPGVLFEQLNAKMAVPACEAAVARDPTNGRLLYQLGRAYEKAGRIDDPLAGNGQAGAAHYASAYGAIGYMYSIGRGVEKNDSTAFEWFRKGAEAGEPASQFTL